VLILSIGYSQVRIDDWKALTSPLNVRDLTNLDNELFAATRRDPHSHDVQHGGRIPARHR